MKDIYTILGEIGLTVPEEKKTAFDTAVRENYKTVSEHDKVVRARDEYKSQLDTANNTISELEKNKGDVASLQSQIDTYKQEKADREKAELRHLKNSVCSNKAYLLKSELKILYAELKDAKETAEYLKTYYEPHKGKRELITYK